MKKIKVVHIQYKTTTASPDKRLHDAFLDAGIDSKIINLLSTVIGDENIISLGGKARLIAKLDTKIKSTLTKKSNTSLGSFTATFAGSNLSELPEVQNADLIYVHWVLNGFMSLKNIEQLAKLKKPIILYMHDMWFITGGCHYSLNCDKYKKSCHTCPVLATNKKKDLSFNEFKKKLKLYAKYDNLFFATPSKWLYDCTKQSALTKNKPVFHIPNMLDTGIFKSYDKKVAKEILNLDVHEKVLAFGAIAVNSPYKGWAYLQEALEILYLEKEPINLRILIFGSGYNKQIAEKIPFKTTFAGFLSSDYATSLMYNAADVFVAPSLADNFPYTVFEAESCGTPVVAFRTGGIPEFIEHKKNGYLAEYKNAQGLAEGIKYCIDNNLNGYRPTYLEPKPVLDSYVALMESLLQKGNPIAQDK